MVSRTSFRWATMSANPNAGRIPAGHLSAQHSAVLNELHRCVDLLEREDSVLADACTTVASELNLFIELDDGGLHVAGAAEAELARLETLARDLAKHAQGAREAIQEYRTCLLLDRFHEAAIERGEAVA